MTKRKPSDDLASCVRNDCDGIPGHYKYTEAAEYKPKLPRPKGVVDERTEVWLEELQNTYLKNEAKLRSRRGETYGIRSSQICALVRMLVERGILE